jgi:hypothetical protein
MGDTYTTLEILCLDIEQVFLARYKLAHLTSRDHFARTLNEGGGFI